MEETATEGRTGLLGKIVGRFVRQDDEYEEEEEACEPVRPSGLDTRREYVPAARGYTVCLRKQIVSFDDVLEAAHSLKRGEQQILNLTSCEPATRQKIVDFMAGVNFSENGTWEEVGTDIYLICPLGTYLETCPANSRMNSLRN